MGGDRVPARERWRGARRSIWFAFGVLTVIPLAALVAVWGFAGATVSAAVAQGGRASLRGAVLADVVVAAAIGLAAIVVAALLLGLLARQVSRDMTALEVSAQRFADQQMPDIIARLRRGHPFDPLAALPPPPATRITEFGRVAGALASVQRTAVTAAAAETGVRSGISRVFVSLARRNQSLLQRQLRLIDELERKAAGPSELADLFPLDHLTTRMRRHAEGLIILSGAAPGRAWSSPVPVIDVIRGAIAEVEDYKRVHVVSDAEGLLAGSAVADMIHLLAELVENATLFSPSGTRVEVRTERVGNGFVFEIEDRGLGIKPESLDSINQRLASPADFDMADADQLGLFVVSKLAARHGVRVVLRPSPYGGTTAIVFAPQGLVSAEADAPATPRSAGTAALSEGLQLALTGPGRRDQADLPPPQRLSRGPQAAGSSDSGPAPTAPRADTGPIPSIPRRRAAIPGRPDSVPLVDTHLGLPRRVRQTSLSPHLRDDAAAAAQAPARREPEARSPEQARATLTSLQRGWERGRSQEAPEPGPADDPGGGAHEAGQQEG